MRRCFQVAALVLALGGARAAQAQTYEVDLDPDRFVTTSDPTSIALTESATPLDARTLAVGLALRLGGGLLPVCAQQANGACTVEGDIVGDRVGADVTFAMGFGRVGVHAQLPVVLHQRGDFGPAMGEPGLSSTGIGDLRLGAKAWLARGGGATLGADLTVSVPTGSGDFIGDGGTVIEPRVIADWRRGSLALVGSAGYALRTSPQTIAELYVDDELLWNAGVEYAIVPAELSAGVALFGRVGVMTQSDPMVDDGAPSDAERMTEVLASGRYWATRSIALEVGAGTAVEAGYGAPSYRVLAGVRWVKRPPPERKIAPTPEPEPEPEPEPAPVADRDGDGILDETDACPDEAEDGDGFQDEDGCPDLDNDADGLADTVDRCPNAPETANGFEDEDGCPDDVPPPPVARIEVGETIYFDLNKAAIKRPSRRLLKAVIDTLATNPGARVRLEGHTDDTGSDAWNQRLSEHRAEAVRAYLIDKGVAADRLEAVGYGNTRPKVENTNAASRRKNRRVEFVQID